MKNLLQSILWHECSIKHHLRWPVAVLGPGRGRGDCAPRPVCSRPPVSWPPMIFCKDNTSFWFFCLSKFFENRTNLRLPLNVQKPKGLQLQGALLPWPSDQGLCPWTPLGALPSDPHYRLALLRSPSGRGHAPQTLRARTATGDDAYTAFLPILLTLWSPYGSCLIQIINESYISHISVMLNNELYIRQSTCTLYYEPLYLCARLALSLIQP